jgi:hypothetical protein
MLSLHDQNSALAKRFQTGLECLNISYQGF